MSRPAKFKLTSSPSPGDMARLNQVADLIRADRRILVTRTTRPEDGVKSISTNIDGALKRLLAKES